MSNANVDECPECGGFGMLDICNENCRDPDCMHEEVCPSCGGTGVFQPDFGDEKED